MNLFLRYQSEELLYAVSVCRRDGVIAIKKKVPGGDVKGGTYYTLASASLPSPAGVWQRFHVSIKDRPDGAVVIRLGRERELLVARDSGIGDTAPISGPGRIGIRGDNAEFEIDDVVFSRS